MARIPVYKMIEEDMRAQIASGELPALSQFPSETVLAARYGVSRMTVRQALERLESARLIVRQQGSGSFVADTPVQGRLTNQLRSFADELARRDVTVSSRLVVKETVYDPPEVVKSALKLGEQQATHLVRVRLVDGSPAAFQDAWIPFQVAPGLARIELLGESLYRTMREQFDIEFGWADQYIVAGLLPDDVAQLLEVPPGTPATEVRRTTYSKDHVPVEYVQSWTRPEFPLIVHLEAG